MTQAELARRVGVSASYLNLIEWNKRRIAGRLLRRIAEALDLSLDALDGASERRLLQTLGEVAAFPELEGSGVERERTNELIGRFPGWARAAAALARSARDADARAQMLSDRMSNDPYLSQTVHAMLSRIAVVRSAAEILAEFPDISKDQAEAFSGMILEEALTLSEVGEALVAYFDRQIEADATLTPVDEAERLFEGADDRLIALDEAASGLSGELDATTPTRRAAAARAIAAERLGPEIARFVETAPGFATDAGRRNAAGALTALGALAMQAPRGPFWARAADVGYDVEALADAFALPFDLACQRLAAAPPPDAPRFGYVRANAAGAILQLMRTEDLDIPRYAPVCPLWTLFRAQQAPGALFRQVAAFPNGRRYVFLARARNAAAAGFGQPRHYLTDMLTLREDQARATVYRIGPDEPAEEVGPGCRLCPRTACPHRAEHPLVPTPASASA